MANIKVAAYRRREIEELHREWAATLPRKPGQIGGPIVTLVEGPPVYTPGEVTAHSDFELIEFLHVDPRFLDFLRERGVPFQES